MLVLLLFAPFDWFVLALLYCAELVGSLLRKLFPNIPPEFSPIRPECSFVILSFNSKTELEESLPPLLEAVRGSGANHEVIVVDNQSTDNTGEYLRKYFPEVRLVSSPKNIYFGAGIRLGIQAATRDILVLMNVDTIVSPGFLSTLLAALKDPAVFGVASTVSGHDGSSSETGNTHARFNGTNFEWRHDPVPDSEDRALPVFWLHRGLCAIDRRKYTWLGGFDRLYDPLYMEDIDLSYRAWKAGWKCLLAVDSQVSHHHLLGTPTRGESFLRMIARRNQYIFFWKNISDLPITAKFMWRSCWTRACRASLPEVTATQEIRSWLGALERLPLVLARKVAISRSTVRSDREVFDLIAGEKTDTHEGKVLSSRCS
jgi:GT2 family glycosyltransferase